MTKRKEDGFARKVWIIAILVLIMILLVAVIWRALDLLLLLFAGVVLGIAFDALRDLLCKQTGMPRWLGLALVLLGAIGFFTLFFVLITPTLMDQFRTLGDSLDKGWTSLQDFLSESAWGQSVLESFHSITGEQSLAWIREQGILGGISSIFSTTLGAISSALIILLTAIYISFEPRLYLDGLIALLPVERRERMREVAGKAGSVLRWWLLGQLCSMALLGVLMTIGLSVLGVPLALAIGIFTAAMTFIPNLGPILAAIPALLMALTVSPMTAVYATVLIVIIQVLEGSFITPSIHRRIISLPPLLIIGVQIVLGSFAGFAGILVAMPLVATVMVLVQECYIKDVLEGG